MFIIAYAFTGQVHVFLGRVKIVSHSSCRTSAILKYFLPVFASISAVTVYLEGVYWPAIANLCQNDLSDDMEAHGLVEILRQFLRVKAIGEFHSFQSAFGNFCRILITFANSLDPDQD